MFKLEVPGALTKDFKHMKILLIIFNAEEWKWVIKTHKVKCFHL